MASICFKEETFHANRDVRWLSNVSRCHTASNAIAWRKWILTHMETRSRNSSVSQCRTRTVFSYDVAV